MLGGKGRVGGGVGGDGGGPGGDGVTRSAKVSGKFVP
jgi:hypothetical protein